MGIAEHLCELLAANLGEGMRKRLTVTMQAHEEREREARRRDSGLTWQRSDDGEAVTADGSNWYQAMHRLGQQCKSKL